MKKGYLDLLVKIYRANENLNFPSGGKMTPYLESLEVGAKVHLEGPFGNFNYEGQGNCLISDFFIIQRGKKRVSKEYLVLLVAVESHLFIRS